MPEHARTTEPEATDAEPERRLGDGRNWLVDAIKLGWYEVRLYVATFVSFCRAPYRFGQRWGETESPALNPLAFLATSAAILGLVAHLGALMMHENDDGSFWFELIDWVRPYFVFALCGGLCHLFFLRRPRRRRLHSSIAMGLYAGAGPATLCGLVAAVLVVIVRLAIHAQPGKPLLSLQNSSWHVLALWDAIAFLPLGWFLVSLGAALAGLHGASRWRSAVAVLATQLMLAVLAGYVMFTLHVAMQGSFLPTMVINLGGGHGTSRFFINY